jgi:hypothetical protein
LYPRSSSIEADPDLGNIGATCHAGRKWCRGAPGAAFRTREDGRSAISVSSPQAGGARAFLMNHPNSRSRRSANSREKVACLRRYRSATSAKPCRNAPAQRRAADNHRRASDRARSSATLAVLAKNSSFTSQKAERRPPPGPCVSRRERSACWQRGWYSW